MRIGSLKSALLTTRFLYQWNQKKQVVFLIPRLKLMMTMVLNMFWKGKGRNSKYPFLFKASVVLKNFLVFKRKKVSASSPFLYIL
jgi:hypothetical protein